MRIAVDTNVFSALLSGGPDAAPEARVALEDARAAGALVVSPAVYAEFAARRSSDYADAFFSEKGVEVDWRLDAQVWRTAGTRYGDYARARSRQKRRSRSPAYPGGLLDRCARAPFGPRLPYLRYQDLRHVLPGTARGVPKRAGEGFIG